MNYTELFSERLISLRNQKGVSARDMSLSLGQSESYINKIENRKALPSMTGFFYICEYLNITPMEFFDFDSPSPLLTNEFLSEVKKLNQKKTEHLLMLVKDLTEK